MPMHDELISVLDRAHAHIAKYLMKHGELDTTNTCLYSRSYGEISSVCVDMDEDDDYPIIWGRTNGGRTVVISMTDSSKLLVILKLIEQ